MIIMIYKTKDYLIMICNNMTVDIFKNYNIDIFFNRIY